MLWGCDISSFQGKPNFDTLQTGVNFVVIKASEGVGFADPQFLRSQSEARRVGIARGYYHFARPDLGNTPESEAEWFLKVVGTLQTGELLVLDFEVNYPPVAWCKAFLDHISARIGGYKPLIYLNLSLIENNDWSSVINANYGLWLAHYGEDPNNPTFDTAWNSTAFLQYADNGTFPGVTGSTDADVFYGDAQALASYGYNPQAPIPSNPGTEVNGAKATRFDQMLTALFQAGFLPDDHSENYIKDDQALTALNSLIADRNNQSQRAGKWDQTCLKFGFLGDSNKVTPDDIFARCEAKNTVTLTINKDTTTTSQPIENASTSTLEVPISYPISNEPDPQPKSPPPSTASYYVSQFLSLIVNFFKR